MWGRAQRGSKCVSLSLKVCPSQWKIAPGLPTAQTSAGLVPKMSRNSTDSGVRDRRCHPSGRTTHPDGKVVPQNNTSDPPEPLTPLNSNVRARPFQGLSRIEPARRCEKNLGSAARTSMISFSISLLPPPSDPNASTSSLSSPVLPPPPSSHSHDPPIHSQRRSIKGHSCQTVDGRAGRACQRDGARFDKGRRACPVSTAEFDALHKLIRPAPRESRWMEIDWFPSIWEAQQRAALEGKPLFIWAGSGGAPAAGC
jgi:hypothetical protein